jgi:methionyl-tRNA formyltransferase
MIPARLIERFKQGLIVVHPSLLPKYRGGAPIYHAIANG